MTGNDDRTQPLKPSIEQTTDGWSIRLPVQAEDVHIEKRTVVYEEVEIRREYVPDVPPRAES